MKKILVGLAVSAATSAAVSALGKIIDAQEAKTSNPEESGSLTLNGTRTRISPDKPVKNTKKDVTVLGALKTAKFILSKV